ncbi:hypothetical protein LEP3755_34160 [Leptolyngbya sp. NIES-3755]|nr:hypothetical protein LEP3755_34160 [Leptolyngbya sp. NIES-3755]
MPSTPMSVIQNANVKLELAILPAGSFVKPAQAQFKTLTAANDASIKFDNQDVSVDAYGVGFATQSAKVSGSFSADVSGIVQSNDPAYKDVLIPLGGNTSDAIKNAYMVLTLGDNSKFEGPVMISNLSINLKMREIARYQCSLKGLGEITFTAAPVTP